MLRHLLHRATPLRILNHRGIRRPSYSPSQYPLSGQPTSAITPENTPAVVSFNSNLENLIAQTEMEVGRFKLGKSQAEVEQYTQQQVNLRLLYFLAGQPERAMQPISGLPAAEQEFWQQVFLGTGELL